MTLVMKVGLIGYPRGSVLSRNQGKPVEAGECAHQQLTYRLSKTIPVRTKVLLLLALSYGFQRTRAELRMMRSLI